MFGLELFFKIKTHRLDFRGSDNNAGQPASKPNCHPLPDQVGPDFPQHCSETISADVGLGLEENIFLSGADIVDIHKLIVSY